MQALITAALFVLGAASPIAIPNEPNVIEEPSASPVIPVYLVDEDIYASAAVETGFLAWKKEELLKNGAKLDPDFSLDNLMVLDIPEDEEKEDLAARGTTEVYGQGQNVAVNAPGIPSKPAYHGFPSRGTGPAQPDIISAARYTLFKPGVVPVGVNPPQCTPKKGQYPVILIPGTMANAYDDWASLGPKLADKGLCVYTFNHNPAKVLVQALAVQLFPFVGDIGESAMALDKVVDEVLSITGASKVDLVGHSQGAGALPFYYLKNLMKGSKVRKMIGIAPSLGTSYYGLNELFNFFGRQIWEFNINSFVLGGKLNTAAFDQQLTNSDFMNKLNSGGSTIKGVEYVSIATTKDNVLVPYTNCLLPKEEGKNITNIILQNVCSQDLSDHASLTYSRNVHQIVINHIFNTDTPITCYAEKPLIPISPQ